MAMPEGLLSARPALPGFFGGETNLVATEAGSVLPAPVQHAGIALAPNAANAPAVARATDMRPDQYEGLLNNTRRLLGAPLAEQRELSGAMLARLGMNWNVSEHPTAAMVNGVPVAIVGSKSLRRDDNGDILSVVSDGYGVVQNSEAFKAADALVVDGGAQYVGAWTFNGGRQVCVKLKLSVTGEVVDGDRVVPTLILRTGHGATGGSVKGSLQIMRLICLNGAMAREDVGLFTVRHTRNALGRVRIGQADVERVFRNAAKRIETFRAMSKVVMTAAEMRTWLEGVIPFPERNEDGSERARARANVERLHREIMDLADHGRGADLPGVRGTLWGAYNAVTEHVDHVRGARAGLEAGLYLTTFGAGADVKIAAFDAAVAALRTH